ncbi:MAG: zinc ribbon domain-containing protein [Planctomycetaceae bacterium]|nr:hypothetical protein [Planctomycetaceae bacterium]
MPAWPGGECPDCGDYMPPNLITCQTCRALLNPELEIGLVQIPEFIPLKEISPEELARTESGSGDAGTSDTARPGPVVPPRGFFVRCPGCRQELKIPEQFAHARVQCKHCNVPFVLDQTMRRQQVEACYANCPHCSQRLRVSVKFVNKQVACNFCGGALMLRYEP